MMTVADVIRHLEALAPSALAESWDNCGLQVGASVWPVKRIWVALDPLPEVVAAACENAVDMLVTHHPLIFKPLMRIDVETPVGRIIAEALGAKLAIFCAHTSYDSALDGLNDVLARRIGVDVCRALVPATGEDPASKVGLGRIGVMDRSALLEDLARDVGGLLNLEDVQVIGNPRMVVHEVALCSGSGGSLVEHFLSTTADVYITGEIRYHQARAIAAAGRGAIDIGHFGSERIMIQDVAERLRRALGPENVIVTACGLEKDPFTSVRVLTTAADKTL
jgi:dinuclear metal center YbgI/SA1388 family protein